VDRIGEGEDGGSSITERFGEGDETDAVRRQLNTGARDNLGAQGVFDRLVFLNDVVFCEGDLLRLLLHGSISNATLACGLDFHHSDGKGESDFYDKWVATDLNGHHALPPNVGGGAPERLLHKRPGAWLPLRADKKACGSEPPEPCAAKFEQPSQVYCCWNGIAVFDARPFYEGARFRWAAGLDPDSPHSGECAASECSLMCKDLWHIGSGRVLLDPAVQLAYSYRTHANRVRYFSKGAAGAVPPEVKLNAPQPDAWDCYGLAQPGQRGIRWKKEPVRESLRTNTGPLPYGPDWKQWPAVVASAAEREYREAERTEQSTWLWRGMLHGAAAAVPALIAFGYWARRCRLARAARAEYARIG